MNFEFVVPTLLGLEALCAKELKMMGYETTVQDGRVMFCGDETAVARANINLRTGERVLIKTAQFRAESFNELFEKTKSIDWWRFIPSDGVFPVKGHCLKSKLASVPDCQSVIKKAISVSLGEKYNLERLPESGALFRIQFSIRKDIVILMLDTSGAPLYKRGYRTEAGAAPLRETIAAAMVMLSFWKYETPLIDPFCGSGTILIEAAMFKRRIAPGICRSFAAENFPYIPENVWENERRAAKAAVRNLPLKLYGYDINPECISIASANAKHAGVGDCISFDLYPAEKFAPVEKFGTVICNPPYGERLGEKSQCEMLYRNIGKAFLKKDYWSFYIITSHEDFESLFGRRANKRRKVYNGMIKCNIYQYFGRRPEKGEAFT
ncbi:MAG: class I SAM-dependent RNA methyltransferase [Clostridia bacterium]|nr:class I SAM-dependent RNA methyltransferase [Clostridia bacterium]